MKVLLMLAHSIAEYDDLRMLSDLGYDVFSIGAYSDPVNPATDLYGTPFSSRPALPQAKDHPGIRALCVEQRERHHSDSDTWAIDWAKADLHPDLIDWADVVICHHYLDRWIAPQWTKLRDKTVIWRTCGQSDPRLEFLMKPLRAQGLRIVRYSPKEAEFFSRIGAWAGEDTLIRFGKYLDDFPVWTGWGGYVANVTQDMAGRGDWCGLSYWLERTAEFDAMPAGPKSEKLPNGLGALDYPAMLRYLAHAGAYVYTGTSPASYTLGLIEAMAVGVPIEVMPAERFMVPGLFEAPDIVLSLGKIEDFLGDENAAGFASKAVRERADQLFDVRKIGRQWLELLGAP